MTIYNRVMADHRRRIAIGILSESREAISMEHLAKRIAEEDDDAVGDDIAVLLHHSHLPLLDDVDAIEYDPNTRMIFPRSALQELAELTTTLNEGFTGSTVAGPT